MSDTQLMTLKAATRSMVRVAGGQEAAASVTRVGAKTLSDYGNTAERHESTFMPVDVLVDLLLDARDSDAHVPLLDCLCEIAGGRFVHLPSTGEFAGDVLPEIDRAMEALKQARQQIAGDASASSVVATGVQGGPAG